MGDERISLGSLDNNPEGDFLDSDSVGEENQGS